MKAVAYGVLASEKEYFAKANNKKHDITLIANPLGMDTVHYAEGKEAIILPEGYLSSKEVTNKLCGLGIKYIITRPTCDNISALPGIADKMIKDLDTTNEDNRLMPVS